MVEFGRHTSLRTRRRAHWEFESPPAHQFYSRGGIGRRGSLKTSVDVQVRILPGVLLGKSSHAPDRTVTVAASKTAIRGSIPRGCAKWEMPKWSRRRSAKPLLQGSSPGSHSIGGREATATLSGPENQRSGKDPDGGSTPPPSAITLKLLIFCIA